MKKKIHRESIASFQGNYCDENCTNFLGKSCKFFRAPLKKVKDGALVLTVRCEECIAQTHCRRKHEVNEKYFKEYRQKVLDKCSPENKPIVWNKLNMLLQIISRYWDEMYKNNSEAVTKAKQEANSKIEKIAELTGVVGNLHRLLQLKDITSSQKMMNNKGEAEKLQRWIYFRDLEFVSPTSSFSGDTFAFNDIVSNCKKSPTQKISKQLALDLIERRIPISDTSSKKAEDVLESMQRHGVITIQNEEVSIK